LCAQNKDEFQVCVSVIDINISSDNNCHDSKEQLMLTIKRYMDGQD
jgi:hypothetical protein